MTDDTNPTNTPAQEGFEEDGIARHAVDHRTRIAHRVTGPEAYRADLFFEFHPGTEAIDQSKTQRRTDHREMLTQMNLIYTAKIRRSNTSLISEYSSDSSCDLRRCPPMMRALVHTHSGIKHFCKSYFQPIDDRDQLLIYRNEVKIHEQMMHPNVLKLIEIFEMDDSVDLVFEYLSGISLLQLIAERGALATPLMLHLAKQVLELLAFFKEMNIVIRDLSPSAWLVTDDPIPRIVLTSFYLAGQIAPNQPAKGAVGPMDLMAPEMFDQQEYTTRVDMWGFGCLLYIMITGSIPFPGPPLVKEERALRARFNTDHRRWQGAHKKIQYLVKRCLTIDVNKRLTPSEALSAADEFLNMMAYAGIPHYLGQKPGGSNGKMRSSSELYSVASPDTGLAVDEERKLIESLLDMATTRYAFTEPRAYDYRSKRILDHAAEVATKILTRPPKLGPSMSYSASEHTASFLERAILLLWANSGPVRRSLLAMYAMRAPSKFLDRSTRIYEALRQIPIRESEAIDADAEQATVNVVLRTNQMRTYLESKGYHSNDVYTTQNIEQIIESLDFYRKGWIPLIRFQAAFVGSPLIPLEPHLVAGVLNRIPLHEAHRFNGHDLVKALGLPPDLISDGIRTEIEMTKANNLSDRVKQVSDKQIPISLVSGQLERLVETRRRDRSHDVTMQIWELRDVMYIFPSHYRSLPPNSDPFSTWIGAGEESTMGFQLQGSLTEKESGTGRSLDRTVNMVLPA